MKKWIALLLCLVLTAFGCAALAEADTGATDAPAASETGAVADDANADSADEADEDAADDEAAMPAVVEKLAETHWYTYAVVIALALFAIAMVAAGKQARWDARTLAYAALCIALSYILSCIRLYRFSFGGSITLLSMLPIIAFALARGPLQGMVVGCAYGLLQLLQDFYVSHPVQLLMDYPLAFAALGLAGIVKFLPLPDRARLPIAVFVAAAGRYLLHVISGAVFFGKYAEPGQTALTYSLIYNIGYMGPDAALCLLASLLPFTEKIWKQMRRPGRP